MWNIIKKFALILNVLVLIAIAALLYQNHKFSEQQSESRWEVSEAEFFKQLGEGKLSAVKLGKEEITGYYAPGQPKFNIIYVKLDTPLSQQRIAELDRAAKDKHVDVRKNE